MERKAHLSRFVQRLISRPVRSVEPPPRVDEPLSDHYLIDFAAKCAHEQTNFDTCGSSNDDSSDSESSSSRAMTGSAVTSRAAAQALEGSERQRTVTLKNLPFSATPRSVRAFCEGFDLEEVLLPTMPDNPKRFAGYALVTFSTVEEAARAAAELNGASCEGREVFTRQHPAARSTSHSGQRLADNSRYFIPRTEALQLGAGHGKKGTATSAAYPRRFPCFLCARDDGHTAGGCPEQVCFRCQRSGHAARDCPPKRWGRLSCCALCGGTNHETITCDASAASVQLLGDRAECLCCRQVHGLAQSLPGACRAAGEFLGHAPLPKRKDINRLPERARNSEVAAEKKRPGSDVAFCASCGEKGHQQGRCRFFSTALPQRQDAFSMHESRRRNHSSSDRSHKRMRPSHETSPQPPSQRPESVLNRLGPQTHDHARQPQLERRPAPSDQPSGRHGRSSHFDNRV